MLKKLSKATYIYKGENLYLLLPNIITLWEKNIRPYLLTKSNKDFFKSNDITILKLVLILILI